MDNEVKHLLRKTQESNLLPFYRRLRSKQIANRSPIFQMNQSGIRTHDQLYSFYIDSLLYHWATWSIGVSIGIRTQTESTTSSSATITP